MTNPAPSPAEPIYAVRLTTRADRDANEAGTRLAELTNENNARAWFLGFHAQIGTLATQPHRYALLADESKKIGTSTRRMLYHASGSMIFPHFIGQVVKAGLLPALLSPLALHVLLVFA